MTSTSKCVTPIQVIASVVVGGVENGSLSTPGRMRVAGTSVCTKIATGALSIVGDEWRL